MPSNHLILCHPLLLLPSIFSSTRVFSNELVLHIRWPKYWSFSFSISPSNEYSGLISFRMDWLDLLAQLLAQLILKPVVYGPASVCVQLLSCVHFFVTLWTGARQAPPSTWLPRQKYWSGLPCPPPGDLPELGIKRASPAPSALAGRSFYTEPSGNAPDTRK